MLLGRATKAHRILQIAYYRKSDFPEIDVDGRRYQIPKGVLSHFRNLRNVARLSEHPITVFGKPFRNRERYAVALADFIAPLRKERCVVCLDPDTGLEPKGGAGPQHVKSAEAREIWDMLPAGWTLALYQNETNKAGKPWKEEKREQFARAIGVPLRRVGLASAPRIAKDIALLFAKKRRDRRPAIVGNELRGAHGAPGDMSLSDYLLRELRQAPQRPTLDEIRKRLSARSPTRSRPALVAALRAEREGR